MSKNLTRKGLALGAVVALGASLFAGTPATAAPSAVYLDTAFGTSGASQTGVLGQYFTLSGTAVGASADQIVKYYIEGAKAADVTATGRFVTDLETSASTSQYVARTGANLVATDNDAKTTTVLSSGWEVGKYYQLAIQLNSTNITSTTSVKVTPFFENGTVDNKPNGVGDVTGTPVTINFVKGSEITATPTLTTVTPGAAVKASVAVTGGVNLSQFRDLATGGHNASPFTVDFKESGSAWAAQDTDVKALWNKTTSVFEAASVTTATAGNVYGATANVNAVDSASATAVKAAAGEVSALSNLTIKAGTSYKATGVLNTSDVVRSGSGTITAKTNVDAVAGKSEVGQKVTFVISETDINSLPVGATISAGGSSLTIAKSATTEDLTVTVVSNADGDAELAISYTGVTVGKTFSVYAKAVGAQGIVYDSGSQAALTLMGEDSVAKAVVDVRESGNTGTAVYRVAKTGTYSIEYQVVDQFGQVPSGTFRAVISHSGSGATSTSLSSPIAVSSGKFTVNGTDISTTDGSYTVSPQIQKLGTDGTTYTDVSSVTVTSTVSVGAVKTPAAIALTAATTSSLVRNGAALVAGNTDLEQGSVSRTTASSTNQTISAVVTDASGAFAPGVAVTFSATGVLFASDTTVYGLGSLTVYTDASGATGNVYYYSNNTGKQTITVTSGSVTETKAISWAAVNDGGSAWTVTAPAYILPGQTLKVSAVLKDAFGALVDTPDTSKVKVVYTGAGYVTALLPTQTDEDGAVSFTVLLGAADTGTSTVKFIYAGTNGTLEETTLNDDVVATASIVIGKAPVAGSTVAISASTGKFYTSVTNAAGKKVVVKVAGKFVKSFTGTAAKKTLVTKTTKGSKKVTVFVGGKLVATKTINVR